MQYYVLVHHVSVMLQSYIYMHWFKIAARMLTYVHQYMVAACTEHHNHTDTLVHDCSMRNITHIGTWLQHDAH